MTAAPTGPCDHLPAIMQAMLRLTDNLEFDGKPSLNSAWPSADLSSSTGTIADAASTPRSTM